MPHSVPAILTPALLSSIRTHPALPKHTWYFIAGVTLSVLNRPDEIATVFKDALVHGGSPPPVSSSSSTPDSSSNPSPTSLTTTNAPTHDEQLAIARRLREALIKTAPIAGLPKTINALLALKAATPPALLDAPLGYSPTARAVDVHDTAAAAVMRRGEVFFGNVYGKVAARVMGQMDRSGTEDLGLTARLLYGYVLSNTAILGPADTSLVLVAALVPQDVNPQLKGHLRGALNHGATAAEVRAAREVAVRLCEAGGMRRLGPAEPGGWGWRQEVANL